MFRPLFCSLKVLAAALGLDEAASCSLSPGAAQTQTQLSKPHPALKGLIACQAGDMECPKPCLGQCCVPCLRLRSPQRQRGAGIGPSLRVLRGQGQGW